MVRCKSHRGAALIMVLGVLAVLALLGTSFATLQAVERDVSHNYLDGVRARLAAMSGIEAAVSSLRRLVAADPFPDPQRPITRTWVYYGDEPDEAMPPKLNVPLEWARNPSFAFEDEARQDPSDFNTRPKLIKIEGRSCGFSDSIGGTYSLKGDQFSLRVRDLSGLLYVNDGVSLHGGNDSSVSRNLKRILNRLGDVIGCGGLGDTIVGRRPKAGYRTRQELESVLGPAQFRKAEPFLTTIAWVDSHVANPVPFSAALAKEGPVPYFRGEPAVYRRGKGVDAWGNPVAGDLDPYDGTRPADQSNAIYGLDELFPQWIEIVARAPVNLNSAPREVLIALLSDLQGVFISYRRRNNISPTVGGYCIPTIIHTYSPQGSVPPLAIPVPTEGDEYGFLYKTAPIKYLGSGTTAAGSGVDAGRIADEMIACRDRRGAYATLPFAGPFRNWRQFNAFCDHLVRSKALEDRRNIFYDYKLDGPDVVKGGNITGYGPLVPSEQERQVASQALADVLKANFNPNLHLNETNPDANLHLLVDKTDLLVNSAEFIFTPTGCFEIESVGRVLRARGAQDVRLAADNEMVAMHRVLAGVRLFELHRETNQSQFLHGTIARAPEEPSTSSGRVLEIGPEPDSGPAPAENEWGGYIALPTVGGLKAQKGAGEVKPTPQEGAAWGESIGVRFQWDFDAHHHADGIRKELAQSTVPGEHVLNFPDPGESSGGPYDPVHGVPGRHRIARSFRLPTAAGGQSTGAMPALFPYAPADLRVDGGYAERHAAPAWWSSTGSFVTNARDMSFVASFWVKPSYPPDRSGKPRLMFNSIRHSGTRWVCFANDQGEQNWLGLFYNAGHEAPPPDAVFPTEDQSVFGELQWKDINQLFNGHVPIRPHSFLFARGYGPRTAQAQDPLPRVVIYNGAVVNHEGHADRKNTVFKENRWTHVTLIAQPRTDEYYYGARDWFSMRSPVFNRMLVNGQELPFTLEAFQNHNQSGGATLQGDRMLDWTRHANGGQNSVRFGAPSQFSQGHSPPRGNFSADATLDEFFVWNSAGIGEVTAKKQWLLGRYRKPSADDAVFESSPIRFEQTRREAPPASHAVAPGGGPSGSTIAASPLPADTLELLGMTWTVYGEDSADPEMRITDARSGRACAARIAMTVKSGASVWGPFTDDGYSAVSARLVSAQPVRYLARFEMDGMEANSILLTSPVLDDVTLYYGASQGIRFEYYVSVLTSLGGL